MKVPFERDTLVDGKSKDERMKRRGFATFQSIQDAIQDIVMWSDFNRLPRCFQESGAEIVRKQVATMKQKDYFEEPEFEYLMGVLAKMKKVPLFALEELGQTFGPPESGFESGFEPTN